MRIGLSEFAVSELCQNHRTPSDAIGNKPGPEVSKSLKFFRMASDSGLRIPAGMITRIGPVTTRIGGCDQRTETPAPDESLGHFVLCF